MNVDPNVDSNVDPVEDLEQYELDLQDPLRWDGESGIKNFDVVSAGERDPDAEGAAGMSASKARQLAVSGDFQGFAQALHHRSTMPLRKWSSTKSARIPKLFNEL